MKEGIKASNLSVLNEESVELIHDSSVKLLETQGMKCESKKIFELFKKAGAKMDESLNIIHVPGEMISEALKITPKTFTLYARDPSYDLKMEVGRVYYGMGGTPEPLFYDYEQNGPRIPGLQDMVNCTRVGEALENIDFVMALCSARDVPPEESIFYEYDAMFRNTRKHMICTSPGQKSAALYLEMAAAASGGESVFMERPCVTLFTQPVSPLRITRYSEAMFEAARYNVPIMASPGPMMGATSPATLAGTLAQINAEALFSVVMSQLIKEGNPVIYAPHTGVMDMATAQCTYGSAEQTLARAAVAQLGRFYNIPSFGLGGGVEAKVPDSEAAAQAMMGMLMNALSGLTLTQTLGTMASGLYGSLEMLMICHEIIYMIKRIQKGIDVTDETLSLDVIREVGFDGSFLTHPQTAAVYRSELFFPQLFRRESIDQWKDRGKPSVLDRAHEKVSKIITQAKSVDLPDQADKELTRVFNLALSMAKEISSDS